jgi:hypothetical protein
MAYKVGVGRGELLMIEKIASHVAGAVSPSRSSRHQPASALAIILTLYAAGQALGEYEFSEDTVSQTEATA